MITYPLNNIEYSAEDAELFHCTRTSGVHDDGSFDISVTGTDNKVTISEGIAWINNDRFSGKVIALKEPMEISLATVTGTTPYLEAIVIQFDKVNNQTKIVTKRGISSFDLVAPEVVRNSTIYELHLYNIIRFPGKNIVEAVDILDVRSQPEYCGYMVESVTAIDNTLSKSGFAADAKAVGDALKAQGASWTVLWENASPNSEFIGQTLSTNNAPEYRYIMITTGRSSLIMPNKEGNGNLTYVAFANGTNPVIYNREIRIESNGNIVVYDNNRVQITDSGLVNPSVDNKFNKPHSIVGIKGVN